MSSVKVQGHSVFKFSHGFGQEVATGRSLGQRRYLEQQDGTTGQLNGSAINTKTLDINTLS